MIRETYISIEVVTTCIYAFKWRENVFAHICAFAMSEISRISWLTEEFREGAARWQRITRERIFSSYFPLEFSNLPPRKWWLGAPPPLRIPWHWLRDSVVNNKTFLILYHRTSAIGFIAEELPHYYRKIQEIKKRDIILHAGERCKSNANFIRQIYQRFEHLAYSTLHSPISGCRSQVHVLLV